MDTGSDSASICRIAASGIHRVIKAPFMQFTGIYAITDDKLLSPEKMFCAAEAALNAGVSLLQYRSKISSDTDRLNTARSLLALCSSYGVPLIINDDVNLCIEVGAAGVHIGREDADPIETRTRLGNKAIIGVTCHDSIAKAVEAEKALADYVAFGRFFPSQTKPLASPADLSILSQARKHLSLPIVAIGGINKENGAAAKQAGADMLAVVHAIFGSDDVSASTRELVQLFK